MTTLTRAARQLQLTRLVPILLWLAGCGGGSGESGDYYAGIDGSGTRTQTLVTGPVNGFGSVIVNGVRFDTHSAEILQGDLPAGDDTLHVGDMVTVVGSIGPDGIARAERIYRREGLSGAVEWLSPEKRQFGVLGQTVQIEQETVLGEGVFPSAMANLSAGNLVSVSGYPGPDGLFIASRVALADQPAGVLSGPANHFDAATRTLTIRELKVQLAETVDADLVRDGLWISLRGQAQTDGTFYADALAVDPTYLQGEGSHALEIRGYLEAGSDGEISLNGVRLTSGGDALLKAMLADELLTARELDVRGLFDGHELHVTDVIPVTDSDTRISGHIDDINSRHPDRSLTVDGTRFVVKRDTRIAGPGGERLDLEWLALGQPVIVSGYQSDRGWVATSIQTGSGEWDSGTLELQGRAERVAPEFDQFYLLNRRVTINADTRFLRDKQALTREEFFAQLPGHPVVVEGVQQGQTLSAQQVRLWSFSGYLWADWDGHWHFPNWDERDCKDHP